MKKLAWSFAGACAAMGIGLLLTFLMHALILSIGEVLCPGHGFSKQFLVGAQVVFCVGLFILVMGFLWRTL